MKEPPEQQPKSPSIAKPPRARPTKIITEQETLKPTKIPSPRIGINDILVKGKELGEKLSDSPRFNNILNKGKEIGGRIMSTGLGEKFTNSLLPRKDHQSAMSQDSMNNRPKYYGVLTGENRRVFIYGSDTVDQYMDSMPGSRVERFSYNRDVVIDKMGQ